MLLERLIILFLRLTLSSLRLSMSVRRLIMSSERPRMLSERLHNKFVVVVIVSSERLTISSEHNIFVQPLDE